MVNAENQYRLSGRLYTWWRKQIDLLFLLKIFISDMYISYHFEFSFVN